MINLFFGQQVDKLLPEKWVKTIIYGKDLFHFFWQNYDHLILAMLFGGMIFFIILIIVRVVLLPQERKRIFYQQNKIKNKPLKPLMKEPFWQKYPFLVKFHSTYEWADMSFTYEFFLFSCFLLWIGIVLFGFLLQLAGLFLLFAFLAVYLYIFFIKFLAGKNQKKIPLQLPFVLETLANSIQSGLSLPQAIDFTAKEAPVPFNLIFKQILAEMNYNIPLAIIFKNIQKRTTNEELRNVLNGLIMQDQMGGDIVKMLKRMATWVRQKNKLQKDIRVFTSQGRLSGIIIVLLWPFSAGVFYFLNADYISILFVTSIGKMLLFLSLILELIGFSLIWRIIKIRI